MVCKSFTFILENKPGIYHIGKKDRQYNGNHIGNIQPNPQLSQNIKTDQIYQCGASAKKHIAHHRACI